MAIATDTRRTTAATALLALGLFGCGTGTESVPVPGADDVVTAPVATVDLPPVPVSATTDAPATTTDDAEQQPTPTPTEAAVTSTTAPPPAEPAPSAAPPVDAPVDDDVFLRLGDEGPEVAAMQRKLESIDYLPGGSETGVFDETTRSGLRRFQGDYGLGVDGIFGPITGRALNAAVSSINAEG